MEIVLLERIDKLGQMGDVVTVRPGYARNFLLPQGKALRATRDNIARFEAERAEREARNAERRGSAEELASDLNGVHVTLIRQAADNLQLYGSVKARDIADGLIEQGFEVDRRNVVLPRPIKTLGLHEVAAFLHPEVQVTVVANVARTEDEAAIQRETGKAVGRMADEPDEDAVEGENGDMDAEAPDSEADGIADADAGPGQSGGEEPAHEDGAREGSA